MVHFVVFLGLFLLYLLSVSAQSLVPAIYVFGSSQVDVGNNNYLSIINIAEFYPYGIDFPGGNATGRWSNGKNAADFIAEKLGLPSPKPYLSLSADTNKTTEFLKGINFASGSAGGRCIPFSQQIIFFTTTMKVIEEKIGIEQAGEHLSKSIFVISIGDNDILFHTGVGSSGTKFGITPEQYVQQIISVLRPQLKSLHNHGARKFFFIGAGAEGCLPSVRVKTKTGACNAEANQLSRMFNRELVSLLEEAQSTFHSFSYAFFDMYTAYVELYHKRRANGFNEIKVACCGQGFLNSTIFCNPTIKIPCSNRTNHVFWDGIHNTEATAGLYMSIAFHGSSPFVYPINVKKLGDIYQQSEFSGTLNVY